MGSIKGQNHNPYIEGKYGHLNPNDVVFTPDWLAKQIVGMFDIKGNVLEPCKGEGAFLKYLPEDTEWCEIAEGKNYYDYNKKVDWIVTNPPYSDYNRFLEHSFALADNIVFENNTLNTRNSFISQVTPYLENIQQREGLYAFQVIMDETNNGPDIIDRNQLIGQIYIQPSRSVEYVSLDFILMPTGADFPG